MSAFMYWRKLAIVDLAGSEYYHGKATSSMAKPKQTSPQAQQEGGQINIDLLALKVIRARALKQSRIPFRLSTLTMVLRTHSWGVIRRTVIRP